MLYFLIYYKGIKLKLLLGFTSGIMSSVISSYTPIIYSNIIEILLNKNNKKKNIYYYIKLYILYKILSNIFAGLRGYIFNINMYLMSVKIKKDILYKYITKDLTFFDKNGSDYINNLLVNDSSKLSELYSLNSNVIIRNLTQFLIITKILYSKSTKMYIVSFLLASCQLSIDHIYNKFFYEKNIKNTEELIKKQNDLVHDYIYKIESYRTLGLEDKVKDTWLNNQYNINKKKNTEAIYYGINLLLSQSLNSIIVILLIFYGVKKKINYKIIYNFLLYIDSIIQMINEFIIVKKHLIDNKYTISKINNLLTEPDTNEKWGEYTNDIKNCQIEFNNLNFSYDNNKYIFNNFNLIIPANKITGIYGTSGNGKSTLLKLLLGLYTPNSGNILINNLKIKDYDKNYYYNNIISYVGQDPILFDNLLNDSKSSYAQNNIIGNLYNYDELLYNKVSKLINDISYNSKMSGGQKQRVAICRAFMKKTKILVLDEPTSSLDNNNENKVLELLLDLYNTYNTTIIIVSHKSSNLNICHNLIEI